LLSVPALRQHRRLPVARLDALGRRRESHRRAAPIGASVGDHEAICAGDDVALAQGRVFLGFDLGEADGILAVTRAAGNELVTVLERIRQRGIRLSTLRGRLVDGAAINHFGTRIRAEALAHLAPTRFVSARNREIAAIATSHAVSLPTAAAAVALAR